MIPTLLLAQAFNTYDFGQVEDLLEQKDYEQALFITRINQGLYSKDQLPLLDKLSDSKYLYLRLQICDRIYGRGSRESVDALLRLTRWRLNTYESTYDLYQHLELFSREGDTDSLKQDILLAEAETGVEILRYDITAPLSDYQDQAGDSILKTQNNRDMALMQAYSLAKRPLNKAKKLIDNKHLAQYNRLVDQVNELIGNMP